jgi:Type VI secretion system/phage-baseplate injector OB domain
MDRFPGKYPAIVIDNADPKNIARLKVQVPEILADETTGWFLPCSPYAAAGAGLVTVPPVGSVVFVEWPAGDPSRIGIWSGGMWTDGDGVAGAGPDVIVLLTPAGHRIEVRDTSGDEAIELTAASGAKVTMDQSGLLLSFGGQKIAMTNASVDINDGALTVS